ncbi:tumor necrosis factor receptor superfamily member 4-like isoform X2 [Carassius auratus]|uniref:Tumor necrosis factor receptor superfamily member 4-like isoform X2 n=1 Tax=Carassius auratus TaxID=7957 RepID=A0A6P6M970_CARAU|nr:tumor necrosis factor receptor superfamily member 4-like isoform X2 [Carassius auratus]
MSKWKFSTYCAFASNQDHYIQNKMLAATRRLPRFLLIFSLVLNCTIGADTGCDDWTLNGSDVCCKKCKPGNRLVERCGRDPEHLCTPCEPDTYTTSHEYYCLRCTQCIGKQFTLKQCTISSDTVCGCKAGYRCGNDKCSFCVTECKEGEEPTEERSCRKCPEGKFNDKIHSVCKEWTKKENCPDGQTLVKGNVTSDSMCTHLEVFVTEPKPNQKTDLMDKKEPRKWLPVYIAVGMAGFAVLCIIVSVVAYVKAQNKTEKRKTDTPDQGLPPSARQNKGHPFTLPQQKKKKRKKKKDPNNK